MQTKMETEEAEFQKQINFFDVELREMKQVRDTQEKEYNEQESRAEANVQNMKRLTDQTLKMIMQSESKSAVDTFIRRFKSVKNFDP